MHFKSDRLGAVAGSGTADREGGGDEWATTGGGAGTGDEAGPAQAVIPMTMAATAMATSGS